MKQSINKIAFLTLLTGSLFATNSIKKVSLFAQTSFPISWIVFNAGFDDNRMLAQFTVPDRDTTISTGGGLRRYDAHMAKMFELTHYECLDQQAHRNWNGIRWQYYAGNRDIDMGEFDISCSLARDIATAYGLGSSEITPVTYYRADDTINVPKLNIVDGKVPTWLKFTQSFKPVVRAKVVDDFEAIRSAIIQKTGNRELIQIRPIHIVENWAFASYVYGPMGGQALLKKENRRWRIVTSDGGWIQEASYLMEFGVPRNIALELAAGPDI